MLDRHVRAAARPVVDRLAAALVRAGVRADVVTLAGLVLGVGAALAAAGARWGAALVLWLASRAADALDGPVARHGTGATSRGGFLDIVSDFAVYGGFLVGCAIGQPSARLALLVLLWTYYVNGTAFLALSSALRGRSHRSGLEDERSHLFPGGIAEGTETVAVHALLVAIPAAMAAIAWVFAALVVVTIGQRVRLGARLLAHA